MAVEPYLIDPASLAFGGWDDGLPLALVDLDRAGAVAAPCLPPFPVIGIGDPAHPLAAALDAVVEAPVTIAAIVDRVAACPNAAATIVQLLRATEGLAVERALVVESLAFAMVQGSDEHRRWIAARTPEAALPPGRVVVTRRDDTVRIVIDRPAARNAIDRAMRDALFEALTIAALDPAVRVDLRATGPAFGMGADLAEFGTTRDPATAHAIRGRTLPALAMARCADRVAVHVQGACVGSSLELAAFAGRLTASPAAWFQLPELAMGILPGAGGCVSVPRRIGRQRAALMMLSGRRIDAPTALRWGLVDAIVDEAAVDPGAPDGD